ncbi:MAG: DNA double-strand break repair nuclease NurA [Candidatus Thermoplasmatota archaeon]|nr:DNA double-strand break repair nuclease NurA [Candidatus Thermoplasmatota archaeon]
MDEKTFGRVFGYVKEVMEASRDFEGEVEIGLDEGCFITHLHKASFKKFDGCNAAKGSAIDGSSFKVLDGLSFVIGSRRTGYIIADEKGVINKKIGEVKIEVISKRDAKKIFAEKYEKVTHNISKKIPDGMDGVNGAIRGLEEHAAARDAMNELDEGDVLMMDGSLEGSEFLSEIIKENCEIAMERGVHLVGICKRSDLYTNRLPVLNWIKNKGDKIFKEQRWYYPLSEEKNIYIAKFHPFSKFSFRIDINPMEKYIEEILGKVSAFSNDVSCLGYPYPLAEIHRNVVITSEDVLYFRKVLREIVLKSGFTIDEWEDLFFDYHEYLG